TSSDNAVSARTSSRKIRDATILLVDVAINSVIFAELTGPRIPVESVSLLGLRYHSHPRLKRTKITTYNVNLHTIIHIHTHNITILLHHDIGGRLLKCLWKTPVLFFCITLGFLIFYI